MAAAGAISVWPLQGVGEVRPGDDLATAILEAAAATDLTLQDDDVLVVTQKIVSKAEGRIVQLDQVQPSPLASALAARWAKDARVVELVLGESRRIVRAERGVIICETWHGFICANAGVDCSNVAEGCAALLPVDPDASAEQLRRTLAERTGARLGIIISDTFGRAWRIGQTDVAIGVAGLQPLRRPPGDGPRRAARAIADELAGTAELVISKLSRAPVALIRGVHAAAPSASAHGLIRRPEQDLFR